MTYLALGYIYQNHHVPKLFSSAIQMPTWKNELSTVVSELLAGLGKYSEHCSVSLASMEI